jgi:aldehyde:ferredoxin oxidoreductase
MDSFFGYRGKILDVELTKGKIAERPLSRDIAKLYVGCVGIGGKILYDELPTWVSPLDPENLLIFTTGPVTGTPGLSAGRHSVVTKSPLTGFFGDASAGGFWGAELKKAGFDAIIFRGRAPKPVYLWIRDGVSELRDASGYWGTLTREADRAIKEEVRDTNAWVATIGPAGENLVRFAGIANDDADRYAARCGVGAVMGSKRLKAIAVRGTKPVPVFDERGIRECLNELTRKLRADQITQWTMTWGTSGSFSTMMEFGDTPIKNWTLGEFKDADLLATPGGYAKIRKNQRTCFSCTIHCRPVVTVPGGPYKTEQNVEGPEYETLGALGSNLLIGNPEAVAKLNDLCNLYGLDTISTGGVLGWAMESYERGVITKQDLGGIELNFGSADAAVKVLEMIAYRRGFGDILGEGTRRASRIIGHDSQKWAVEVKGLEMPMHDPRAFQAMSLTYAFSAVGADHMEGETMPIESLPPGTEPPLYPEYGLKATDRLGTEGKAQIAYTLQNAYNAASALGYCLIAAASSGTAYPIEHNLKFYTAATGFAMSAQEFLMTGERIYNLKRAFNFKHGMQKDEDRLPERLLKEPLPSGGAKGSVAHFDEVKNDYYVIRGWDMTTGKPTREKLETLGMNDVAQDMWPKS